MRASNRRWAPGVLRPALWFCAWNLLAAVLSAQCANPAPIRNQNIISGNPSFSDANALEATGVTISGGASVTFHAANCIHLGPGFRATAGTAATTFHAWVDTAPTAVSVSPSSPPPNPPLTQTFTWTVSSPALASNLAHVFALFNTTSSTANGCYIHYDASTDLIFLADDAGTTWLAGFRPSSSESAANSQCTIKGTGSSPNPTAAGEQLGLTLNVTFNAASFSGLKNEYLYALDGSGLSAGWQQMGTWAVPAPPPPAPDFTLTVAPVAYSVKTGVASTVSYAVTVTPQNGFNNAVSFSMVNPMYGCWSQAFNPLVVPPSGTTTVSMQCPAFSSVVSVWATVRAYGGGTTHDAGLQLDITASPVSITTATLPPATVGTPYSAVVAASGGSMPYSWSYSGTLPPGLGFSYTGISSTGLISGTPSTAGTSNFTVQVTDSTLASATRPLTIAVSNPPPVITTTTLSNATVGVPYSASLAATGGTLPYSWSVPPGTLPPGLSLSTGGIISGTPTAAGTANFTVRVTDGASASATLPLTLNVSAGALTITTSSLSSAVVGVPYSATLAAAGGTPLYSWSVPAGLPAGLTLSSGGIISGTPTAAGTANFTVRVTDSASASTTRALTLTVSSSTLSITTTSLSDAKVGTSYSASLSASGGSAPYSWSVDPGSGVLPSGLSLTGSTISGTPTATGTFNFVARVTDNASATTTMALSIVVNAAQTYTLSGHVTAGSCPISGVTVTLTGGGNPQTTTDAAGAYSFSGLASGTYTVTPTKTGYTFNPAPAPVTLNGNATKDFTAEGPAVPSREYIRLTGRVVAVVNCGAQ
mgnify:CR=1 FL=1